MSFRRILVAVDAGPVAAHAADVGLQLARALGAEIALTHAVESSPGSLPESGIPPAELMALAQQEGRRVLTGFRERLSLPPAALEFLLVGPPAAEIVTAASQWPADCIVIGSHGRRGVARALLGSVAEAVLRQAPCPVLVVRATD